MKSALVKVVLCNRCFKKLMWKRERQRQLLKDVQAVGDLEAQAEGSEGEGSKAANAEKDDAEKSGVEKEVERRRRRSINESHDDDGRKKRSRHRHSPGRSKKTHELQERE